MIRSRSFEAHAAYHSVANAVACSSVSMAGVVARTATPGQASPFRLTHHLVLRNDLFRTVGVRGESCQPTKPSHPRLCGDGRPACLGSPTQRLAARAYRIGSSVG